MATFVVADPTDMIRELDNLILQRISTLYVRLRTSTRK